MNSSPNNTGSSPESLVRAAVDHHRAGRLNEAEEIYRRVVDGGVENPDALHLLGQILHGKGQSAEAVDLIRRAIATKPDLFGAHYNLGLILWKLKRLEEAEEVLQIAAERSPSDPDTLFYLAVVLQALGQLKEAEVPYRSILAIDPNHLQALNNLGVCLLDLGLPAEAEEPLTQALEIDPNDIEALNNLGNVLQKLKRSEEALICFEKANGLAPNSADVMGNMARALLPQGEYQAALALLGKALVSDPCNAALQFIDALALPVIPGSEEEMDRARQRLVDKIGELAQLDLKLEDPVTEIGMTSFLPAYHGLNDRDIQENLAQAYLKACPDLSFTADHCGKGSGRRDGKIRVGFLSVHLGKHTIGKLNRGLITQLDRSKFESFVFCPGPDKKGTDPIIDEIAATTDHLLFPSPSLAATRDAVAGSELDILYYLDIGMEPLSYFLAFSRLAPVQCVTWGHPVTTGIPNMDYFISSQLFETGKADAYYGEKLMRFPYITSSYRRPNLPKQWKSRSDLGLPEHANLYVCAQSLFKIHPEFDAMLAAILKTDPQGEIVLIEGQEEKWNSRLSSRFAESMGDDSSRIRFLPRLSEEDFFQLLNMADVILDTPHFCGGNTSLESYAIGKAVVTLPGPYVKSRLTLGFYRQMEIEDLIAKDEKDFVSIAVSLGTDPDKRAATEKRIIEAGPLIFDDKRAITEHERFFLEALESLGH